MFCDEHGTADYCGECVYGPEIEALQQRIAVAQAENARLREALGRILENGASDWKAAEEFGGYVLDDELREEARAALDQEAKV